MRTPVGALLQSVQWHHREHLLDGPVVNDGMKYRKVAQIQIGQLLFQFQLFRGGRRQLCCCQLLQDFATGAPVQAVGMRQLIQGHVTQTHELIGFLAGLAGVVVALQEYASDIRAARLLIRGFHAGDHGR